MRNSFRLAVFLFAATVTILAAWPKAATPASKSTVQSSPQQAQQPTAGLPQAVPPQASSQQVPLPTPSHVGPVIVLDPAHGGTDNGARGQSGVVEKDLVLLFARTARQALEREGFRVVMTRNDDSDPSYDDRAALANSYRDVIFVSFHISSTGTLHTARAYSYKFPDPLPDATNPNTGAASTIPHSAKTSLPAWEGAQRPYADASQSLANLVQTELAQRYPGSPSASSTAAVRGLRSVGAPAIAVEVSNIAVSNPNELIEMAAPVSTAIVHSIVASRPAAGSIVAPEPK